MIMTIGPIEVTRERDADGDYIVSLNGHNHWHLAAHGATISEALGRLGEAMMLAADEDAAALRLAEAKRLVTEGKVEIGNEAFHFGDNAVVTKGIQNGLIFQWSRRGVGFGELTMVVRDGQLHVDTECMGLDFTLDILRQALADVMR